MARYEHTLRNPYGWPGEPGLPRAVDRWIAYGLSPVPLPPKLQPRLTALGQWFIHRVARHVDALSAAERPKAKAGQPAPISWRATQIQMAQCPDPTAGLRLLEAAVAQGGTLWTRYHRQNGRVLDALLAIGHAPLLARALQLPQAPSAEQLLQHRPDWSETLAGNVLGHCLRTRQLGLAEVWLNQVGVAAAQAHESTLVIPSVFEARTPDALRWLHHHGFDLSLRRRDREALSHWLRAMRQDPSAEWSEFSVGHLLRQRAQLEQWSVARIEAVQHEHAWGLTAPLWQLLDQLKAQAPDAPMSSGPTSPAPWSQLAVGVLHHHAVSFAPEEHPLHPTRWPHLLPRGQWTAVTGEDALWALVAWGGSCRADHAVMGPCPGGPGQSWAGWLWGQALQGHTDLAAGVQALLATPGVPGRSSERARLALAWGHAAWVREQHALTGQWPGEAWPLADHLALALQPPRTERTDADPLKAWVDQMKHWERPGLEHPVEALRHILGQWPEASQGMAVPPVGWMGLLTLMGRQGDLSAALQAHAQTWAETLTEPWTAEHAAQAQGLLRALKGQFSAWHGPMWDSLALQVDLDQIPPDASRPVARRLRL